MKLIKVAMLLLGVVLAADAHAWECDKANAFGPCVPSAKEEERAQGIFFCKDGCGNWAWMGKTKPDGLAQATNYNTGLVCEEVERVGNVSESVHLKIHSI